MIKYIVCLFFVIAIIFSISLFIEYEQNNNIKISNLNIINKLEKNNIIDDKEFLNIPKYYINLERSKDRNKKIIDQFNKYQIKNHNRIDAYDIKKIKDYDYINEYDSFLDGSNVELIVTMSHIKAINTAYLNKDEIAMIMEDDINLCTVPFWKIKLKEIIDNIPNDCDFLLLANNMFEDGEIKIKKANQSYDIANGVCYLITRKGMEKLNQNFIKEGKITFLKKQNLRQQPFVFDRGFMNFFNIYYTSQSLFITEDLNQESLIRNNFLSEGNSISDKVLKYYKNIKI